VQEHLVGAGYAIAVDGAFGPGTRDAVSRFQSAAGLSATGQVDPATWPALMGTPATQPQW
jgi:peptidoglycan hydrolase-like protein with peptidoglycan-binding domain